jgi:hypothetical protein
MRWLATLAARQTLLVPGAVAAAVLLGVSVLRPAVTWRGDWELGLQQLFAADLPLFVLVAVVASQASGTLARQKDRGELLTAARPLAPLVVSLSIAVLPAAVFALAGVAWVARQTMVAGGEVGSPLAWIRYLLALTMVGSIGVAAGRLLAPLTAVPVSAGVVAAIYAALPSLTGFELLNLGGARIPLAGMATDVSHAVAGVAVMAVVLTLALAAAVTASRRVAVALVAGAVAALAVTSGLPSASLAAVGDARVCSASGGVTTCVFPGYDRYGRAMSERAAVIRRAAVAAGVPADLLPTTIVQQRAVFRPAAVGQGAFVLSSPELDAGRPSDDTVAAALSYPWWCPQMDDPLPPLGLLRQTQYLQAWLLVVSGSVPPADFAVRAPEGFPDALSPTQRTALVVELLQSGRRCRASDVVPAE